MLLLVSIIRICLIAAGAVTGDAGLESEDNIKLLTGAGMLIGAIVWRLWELWKLRRANIVNYKDIERREKPRSSDPADEVVQRQLHEQARAGRNFSNPRKDSTDESSL
jgi:type VI protein secretion system component VasK